MIFFEREPSLIGGPVRPHSPHTPKTTTDWARYSGPCGWSGLNKSQLVSSLVQVGSNFSEKVTLSVNALNFAIFVVF